MKYLIMFLFLFQTSCLSADKRFSKKRDNIRKHCDRVMEILDVKKSDSEYKKEYKQCLVNKINSMVDRGFRF